MSHLIKKISRFHVSKASQWNILVTYSLATSIKLRLATQQWHSNSNSSQTNRSISSWLWHIPIVVVDSRNSLPEHFVWDLFYYEWDFRPPFWQQRRWWGVEITCFIQFLKQTTNNRAPATRVEHGISISACFCALRESNELHISLCSISDLYFFERLVSLQTSGRMESCASLIFTFVVARKRRSLPALTEIRFDGASSGFLVLSLKSISLVGGIEWHD